jgi:hypothetical protein
LESRFTKVPGHLETQVSNAWPSPQDFNEAIQTPKISFLHETLQESVPEVSDIGLPKPITGAFASVYKMESPKGIWAVKCFLREVRDQRERYEMVSEQLQSVKLPYTIGFEFVPSGILVRGERYPILKMEWLEGATLQDYIDTYRNESDKIQFMCEEFVKMVQGFQQHGIAHGDLQHGNIT